MRFSADEVAQIVKNHMVDHLGVPVESITDTVNSTVRANHNNRYVWDEIEIEVETDRQTGVYRSKPKKES